MALASGTRIGPYEITAQIGVGGMGEVYRATDRNLGREVAIKVLPDTFAQDPERLARFEREAKALASLNHPNIAIIHGLERAEGRGYSAVPALVMEFVEGPTLADRIDGRRMAIDEALLIVGQITQALEAAHEQGIVHRDLKPANIKLRSDGTVKVLDFGLAKAMEPASLSASSMSLSPTITTPAMTQAGVILGTAAYMAPEQARGKPVDKRADIWALGCILFEMLTGSRAFGGELIPDVMASVLKSEPDYVALPPDTPPLVRQVLQRCLRKDPKQRWHDAGDVRIGLELVDQEPRKTAPPDASVAPNRWRERALWSAAVVAAATSTWLLGASTAPSETAAATARSGVLRFSIPTPAGVSLYTGGWIVPFALSPDGRSLAFTATSEDGRSRLWVRPLASDAAQPIAGTEGARTPFWSPNSEWLGFEAQNTWYRVRVPGGTPESISTFRNFTGGSFAAAWGDDVILFVGSTGTIFQVPVQGGKPSQLTNFDPSTSERGHGGPQFLSDGRRFLYVAAGEPSRVYLDSIDGTGRTLVMDMPGGPSTIGYVPGTLFYVENSVVWARPFDEKSGRLYGDRRRVVGGVAVAGAMGAASFSVSRTGVFAYWTQALVQQAAQLHWMDRAGNRLGNVGSPAVYDGFDLSRDGTRLASARVGRDGPELWVHDLAAGSNFPLKFQSRGTVPVWSPDGNKLAFLAVGQGALFVGSANGNESDAIRLTDRTRNQLVQDWTASGERLIYENWDAETGIDLMVLQLDTKRVDRLAWNTSANEFGARLTANDQWVAYVTDQSGRNEVWVAAFPSGQPRRQISSAGGSHPAWKGDGSELYFITTDGRLSAVSFRSDGSSINVGSQTELFRVPGTIDVMAGSHNMYAPSRDGRRFLVGVKSDAANVPPINVIVNWPSLLPKEE